jgi:hypothetical protein
MMMTGHKDNDNDWDGAEKQGEGLEVSRSVEVFGGGKSWHGRVWNRRARRRTSVPVELAWFDYVLEEGKVCTQRTDARMIMLQEVNGW